MNCHSAEKLLSAERDETLGAAARAELDAHVAECAACQKRRALLAESAAAWRTTTADARVPDERIEWQHIRRKLNGAADEAPEASRSGWNIFSLRGATILAAAAAVALGLYVAPLSNEPKVQVINGATTVAMTDTVEIGGDASAAMVYVDDKSGWLVVWAAGSAGGG